MDKKDILKILKSKKLIFFSDEEFANYLGTTAEKLYNNGFAKCSEETLDSYCAKLDDLVDYVGTYSDVEDCVNTYEDTKKFYDDEIKKRKLLDDENILDMFMYFIFSYHYQLGDIGEFIEELEKCDENSEKKLAALCQKYKDCTRNFAKNRKKVNPSLLFLMIKELLPDSKGREGICPLQYFGNTLHCLYDLMANSKCIETIYKGNIPIIYYEYENQYKTFKDNNEESPDEYNMLSMGNMTFSILHAFYRSSNTADIIELVQDVKEEYRYLDIDGLWQTSDCIGKRTDEFWQIQLYPEAMIYDIKKYKVTGKNRLSYSQHNLIMMDSDNKGEFTFLISQPNYGFNLCKDSFVSHEDNLPFICYNGKWDENWFVKEFSLMPQQKIKEETKWQDFMNKTFVRIDDKSISYFQKMLDEYDINDAHPETHMDIDNAPIAFTRNALFIGIHLNEENRNIVLRINLRDEEYDEIINGLDKMTHNSNVVICTTADGKQYLGFDEMNLYIDIEKLLEAKSKGNFFQMRNVQIDTNQIKVLDLNDTFEEIFS